MSLNPEFPFPLYLVLSESACTYLPFLTVAEEAIKGGVDLIQLREKDCSRSEFLAKAIALKGITDHYGIPLIINDEVSIAAEISAWGVHVGQTDMQPLAIQARYGHQFRIGWSLENEGQLNSPELDAVQHLGLSPIFSTKTKTDTITEWKIAGIERIKELTAKPLVAIGRMNLSNAREAYDAGANSIAIVSAICSARDPRKASELLKEQLS